MECLDYDAKPQTFHNAIKLQVCRKWGGPKGPVPLPPFLADQSTLSQPGGQIMPLTLLLTPPDFLTFRHP